jgi:integrase
LIINMPKPRPPHLTRETTAQGKVKWFYREGHGPRTYLKAIYGTSEFWAAYDAAARGQPLQSQSSKARFSIAWCIEQYMASRSWAKMAAESRKQMGYQLKRIEENAGAVDLRQITRKHILEGQQRRAETPSDANKYVRAMSLLCRFAVDQEWISANPVNSIGKLKTGEGFYTWVASDFAAFEAHWPFGTMQRLAYEIFLNTGLRRGDVHKFGRQHIRGQVYTVTTGKTGKVVESTITSRLAQCIEATKCGPMTFLVTPRGIPFASAQSFGNWFSEACKLAGVTGSAHGIRKGLACVLAEKRLSEAELNSFFGWSHRSGESATYIERASRTRMAARGTEVISRSFKRVREKGDK